MATVFHMTQIQECGSLINKCVFFSTKLVIKLGRDNSTNLGTVTLHTERLEVRVAPLTLQWTMLDTCIEEYSQNRTCLY